MYSCGNFVNVFVFSLHPALNTVTFISMTTFQQSSELYNWISHSCTTVYFLFYCRVGIQPFCQRTTDVGLMVRSLTASAFNRQISMPAGSAYRYAELAVSSSAVA